VLSLNVKLLPCKEIHLLQFGQEVPVKLVCLLLEKLDVLNNMGVFLSDHESFET
jgi:hypothetical protein